MDSYNELNSQLEELESRLNKKQEARKQRKGNKKQKLEELHETLDEKNTRMLHKIQELKRKQTILLTLNKIQPEAPENFPKNYSCQVSYEDVNFVSNQKFLDFDENIIEEKFVIPLLQNSIINIQIIVADDNQQIFDKGQIDLQIDIVHALKVEKYESFVSLQNNPQLKISYMIQLQGIGFQSWLKTKVDQRILQQQRTKQKQSNEQKAMQNYKKIQQKKEKFDKMFKSDKKKHQLTQKYETSQINKIMKILNTDQQ